MNRRTLPAPLALSLTLLAPLGCIEEGQEFADADADADADAEDEIDFRTNGVGGTMFNTNGVGGTMFNTSARARKKMFTLAYLGATGTIYGNRIKAVTAPSWTANGIISMPTMDTGELAFHDANNTPRLNLNGVILHFDSDNNGTNETQLRLGARVWSPPSEQRDNIGLWLYPVDISELQASGAWSAWKPLCTGSNPYAIAVEGTWNTSTSIVARGSTTDTFTLTCMDSAIGKAIQNGVRPWVNQATDDTLVGRHVATVKAILAAYDGPSRTRPGIPVDIMVPGTAMPLVTNQDLVGDFEKEAEWDSKGDPLCINYKAIRAYNRIEGNCSADAATRTSSNCPIYHRVTGALIPQCPSVNIASFQYANAVVGTYTSRALGGHDYDREQDVFFGVEEASDGTSILLRAVASGSTQTWQQVGHVRRKIGGVLTNVVVDGLFYKDNALYGYQLDLVNKKSYLVKILQSGIIQEQIGGAIDGLVRGAELDRTNNYIVALARDSVYGNNLMYHIWAPTGALVRISSLPFTVSNQSDIARREQFDGFPAQGKEWYIINNDKLYLLSSTNAPNVQAPPYVNPLPGVNLVADFPDDRLYAGLAFASPNKNWPHNMDTEDDGMALLDVEGIEQIEFTTLSGAYPLSYFAAGAEISPGRNGIAGDLAAIPERAVIRRQGHIRAWHGTKGYSYPPTDEQANRDGWASSTEDPEFYTAAGPLSGTVAFYRCILGSGRYFHTTSATCEGATSNKSLLGYVYPITTPQPAGTTRLHRLRLSNGFHFYTAGAHEKDVLVSQGHIWESGGDVWVFSNPS